MTPRGYAAVLVSSIALVLPMLPAQGRAQTVEELYASGTKARLERNFTEAADLLKRALALKPDNTDALVQLGFAELGLGDTAAARAAFSKALSLAPDYADASFGLAEVEFRSGNLDAARTLAESVTSRQPDNSDAAALLAKISKAAPAGKGMAARKPASARARKERRLTTTPDPVAGLVEKGRALRAAGQFAEAERSYRSALRLAPRNTDILVALGYVQGSRKDFDAAGRSFDRALAIQPGLLDARLGKVRLALWRNHVSEARLLVDAVLATAPANAEALVLDARISLLDGNVARAEQSFRAAVAVDRNNVEALTGLGDAQRARGDDEGARETYRQALALAPGSSDLEDRLAQPLPRKWRIDIGTEISSLTGGRGTWTDSAAALTYRVDSRTTVSGLVRMATRYGHTDTQLEGRIDHAFSPVFSAYGALAATPDGDFLARYSIGGGASWRAMVRRGAAGPLFLNLDARYDRFTGSGVMTVSPWVQGYLFDQRLGLSARWVHARDDGDTRADGYVLRTDLMITPRLSAFAGYSDAPEIDDGSLIPTRSVFGGMTFDLTQDLTLRANLAQERRPTFDRTVFGIGITKRF